MFCRSPTKPHNVPPSPKTNLPATFSKPIRDLINETRHLSCRSNHQRGDSEKCSNQINQAKGTGQLLTHNPESGAALGEQVIVIIKLEGDQRLRRIHHVGP